MPPPNVRARSPQSSADTRRHCRLARSTGYAVVGIDSNAHAITTTLALAHEQGLGERVRFE
jgi:hypothetical protein